MTDIVERLRALSEALSQGKFVALTETVTKSADEIMQLRQQVSDLQEKLGRIMEGLEGTCMTCEPVGVRNQQMVQDIKTLQDQRDEARREVCAWQGATSGKSFRDTAVLRGWDCFREPA